MSRKRVICVGNDLCHDDGVASVVGHTLCDRAADLGDVEVVHAAEFGLSSLDFFLDAEHVVVVDATLTGKRPGSVSVLDAPDFVPSATCSIGHAITISSMLELVARLNPSGGTPRVTVIGIEAENLTPFGTTLTPCVAAAVPVAVELVLSALRSPSNTGSAPCC